VTAGHIQSPRLSAR